MPLNITKAYDSLERDFLAEVL
ncbi:hypothetical protein PybrP1_012424, partial [[Pythium] brassicae (nom. inval.)]